MPNWCSTNVIIRHDDEKKLEGLYNKIVEWTSNDYCDNGFGETWLGNVAGNSGIAEYNEKENGFFTPDGDFVHCRGSITSIDFHGEITIWQDDAWGPKVKLWLLVCKKYLPDADVVYTACEPGCCVLCTNDSNIEGLYYVDVLDPPKEFSNLETWYEAREESVVKLCQDIFKTDETDVGKLLEKVDDLDWIYINKWEYCDAEDCN